MKKPKKKVIRDARKRKTARKNPLTKRRMPGGDNQASGTISEGILPGASYG